MIDLPTQYFDVLCRELGTTLLPLDDENALRVATYCRSILTYLKLDNTLLPQLRSRALEKLSGLVDTLNEELALAGAPPTLTTGLLASVRAHPNFEQMEILMQSAIAILSQQPGDRSAKLMRSIAAINFELQDELLRSARRHDQVPEQATTSGTELSAAQSTALRDYLRHRYPDEDRLDIGKVKAIVGGGSKLTLIVDLLDTKNLPTSVVLRLDKADGVVASTVADEYFLLKIVADAGTPVPFPFLVETNKEILGAPFMMVSRVAGRNIGDWLDVFEPSGEFAVGLARTLAKLHSIPPETVGNRLKGHDISTRDRLARELADFENHWRLSGQTSVALEQAYAWLKLHLDRADGKRAIVHCDVGCHNILADGGTLTALLDWETAVIGNPAEDVANVRHIVVQMMPWEEFLSEYQRAGGTIPSEEEIEFYCLWRAVFGMHYAVIAKSLFNSGQFPSTFLAYASKALYQRLNHRLHESVSAVFGNDGPENLQHPKN